MTIPKPWRFAGKPTAVHQFHPVLAPGDAMSNHVFALRTRLREWGYASDAFAVEAKPGAPDVLPYRRLFRALRPTDMLLMHFSIGHEVFDQLAKLEARKVLVYHNVTPPEFFTGLNDHAAVHARLGLRQLAGLVPRVGLAVGVSEYDAHDLGEMGFENVVTVPILIDWSAYDVEPDASVLASMTSRRTRILFVGRISPNKRQDDLIRMLAYYRACIDKEAQLFLVGSFRDQPQYHARCLALRDTLGLQADVTFTGPVPMAGLVAYYRRASVFCSLSEHEGFGVPLLEAMRLGLPVVAYDAAAVGETLDGGGVLLARKDLAEAAEVCAAIVEDAALRERLVTAGTRRVRDFASDAVAERTREALGL
ncbi:MAG: glycosyltransferase family 4 protein [Chloroflexota bacterium]|nr:glycosyltransferase family 4 protein [Chloroflexota bacterium]MDE3101879.1 glycosyltransferase family 4 protein [Chloroflexota bacterium]